MNSSAQFLAFPIQRKASCTCGGGCAACQARGNLNISQPNDPAEIEADQVADKVMRMAVNDAGLPVTESVVCDTGQRSGGETTIHRKCATCEEEDEKVQRKALASGGDITTQSPAHVQNAVGSGSHSLDRETRNFFESSLGYDLGSVRLHTDNAAADSAFAINAKAYTLGTDIVFGHGEYSPQTDRGRHLLAHELVHVVQQSQAPISTVQRACRSAAQCSVPIAGNAGQFGATVEAESEALAVASGGVAPAGGGPTSCNLPRHRQRATNVEALALGAGLGATIAPGIAGFFVNACLSPNDGANNAPCSQFPGGAPAGTGPDQFCVQLHTTDEDRATALRALPRPLADSALRDFLWYTALVVHESQHNRFDANPSSVASFVPPATDCNLSTTVPIAAGRDVESLLSEISAEIAKFDVYFRNSVANPSRSSTFAMQSEEHNIASRGGENILGNIKALQCVCNCGTVDTFIEQVFNQASSSWPAAEKREFKRAMTGFIPSFWPASLRQR